MIEKFKIQNSKFKIGFIALLLLTLNSQFLTGEAFAQATTCILQPGEVARVEGGLISATERGALDKFGSAEGVCAISNRANFDNPTYADLKSKFYDQAKTTSASTALTTLSTANLIQNPSFETVGGSALAAANWSASGNFTRSADHGANTGCFTAKSAGGVASFSQIVSVTPGTTYTLSGWIFNNGGGALIDVAGGCTASTPQNQSWRQVTCTFTPTTSAVTVRARTESGNSGAWFDDISLNAGSASPISRTSIIKYDPVATDITQSYFNEDGDGEVVTNSVYHVKEDLTINGPITTEPKTLLIFVDKDLNINTNFTYGNSGSGVVFVVGGNVNIDKDVTRIDGIIITSGTFCSATDSGNCDTSDKQLIINGSVITLNPAVPPRFVRALEDNSDPAEKLNFQPKYYGLLANIFTDTVRIYAEITDPSFAFSTSITSTPPAGSGDGTGTGSSTVTTSYPTNNEDEACNPACRLVNASTDTWELNTYFNGQTCGAIPCDPPDGVDCAELDATTCHGTITTFSGSACGRVTCPSNVATYAANYGADDICGTNNFNACNADGTTKSYYPGTTTGTSCNQASCGFPFAPSGNKDLICGVNNQSACNGSTLKSYYTGSSCEQTVCGFPQALDCASLDAAGCHGPITGYSGTSCDPNAVTCPANYDSYFGSATNTQQSVCGDNNIKACNPDGTLKAFSDGSSCSTTGSCGYPHSPAGNKNAICGVNNETSCNTDGTRNKYYPGNSCSQTNCPVPTTSCTQYNNTCHGDILGYDGTSCTKQVICPSNVASYGSSQGEAAVCGTNNTTACDANGNRKTFYTGTLTGTTCNTATCGFPYSPSGNQTAVCGANNATACEANGTVKKYYPGNSCSQSDCGFPPKTAAPTNSCHGDIYGYNGVDCVWRLIYPSTYLTEENPSTDCTADGCTLPQGGGTRVGYTGAQSCTNDNIQCNLNTTIDRCTADGCSSPAGGTRITYHTNSSCAAENCTLNSTYNAQCLTGGVLECKATPDKYHTGGASGSCTGVDCPNNYVANQTSPPNCRMSAYPYASNSCSYDTTSYPKNCWTQCGSTDPSVPVSSNYCYSSSNINVHCSHPLVITFTDNWKNPTTGATTTSTSSGFYNYAEGCANYSCEGNDGNHFCAGNGQCAMAAGTSSSTHTVTRNNADINGVTRTLPAIKADCSSFYLITPNGPSLWNFNKF